ncbi:MAG: sigma-70 family RNA polymerase sigma factor [Candidatus Izemoplasmatales bacterium]|jgi:RNA polymerase sporulation-specific sigma factor|nr:sigma-70 family RNA polymerase sigma factor [Candidatus Izemoplasmatales bacterium]MDD4355123.1 sigma-70 family RNA polymerase sigma factor [Candidatus Izemoplasmatales bacterium]MDD4988311.1 sigma-70 family RNA polymerase sigma factor [Candidatus Izemoplasmatales bacterium]MDY0373914.1 sigma-70 family RNA polymerase sigma factor [Candidatus Izemoplasmatales bacterium]
MNFRNYNDYEIISLIKQGNEEALALMIEKYRLLIAKKAHKFNLKLDFDDRFQEGLIVLYRSILKYDEHYDKTFTRYFEHNLENHLISLYRKERNYGKFLMNKAAALIDYSVDESHRNYYSELEIAQALSELSEFEKAVFRVRFLLKRTPAESAKSLDCQIKQIYNAVDRIRAKIKMHLE